jgi:hypothetical protein
VLPQRARRVPGYGKGPSAVRESVGVHKRCTELVGRGQYQGTRDGRHGTKPPLTAFHADRARLPGPEISNLNPLPFTWSTGSNPVPGTLSWCFGRPPQGRRLDTGRTRRRSRRRPTSATIVVASRRKPRHFQLWLRRKPAAARRCRWHSIDNKCCWFKAEVEAMFSGQCLRRRMIETSKSLRQPYKCDTVSRKTAQTGRQIEFGH